MLFRGRGGVFGVVLGVIFGKYWRMIRREQEQEQTKNPEEGRRDKSSNCNRWNRWQRRK